MTNREALTDHQRRAMDHDNSLTWPSLTVDQWLDYRRKLGTPVPATDPRLG